MPGGALATSVLVCASGPMAGDSRILHSADRIVLSQDKVLDVVHRQRPPRALVILDPYAFPFEKLPEGWWDVPLGIALPAHEGADELIRNLGDAVLGQLGFFDRIAIRSPETWRLLSDECGWASTQRVETRDIAPMELASSLCAAVEAVAERWGWSAKGIHRTREAAFRHVLEAERRSPMASGGVLQTGARDGRWVRLFLQEGLRFTAAAESGEALRTLRRDHPGLPSVALKSGSGIPFERETFGLVFGENLLRKGPPADVSHMIAEMWRVIRPGGALVFLDDFVFERGRGMSIRRFVRLVTKATERRVTLDYLQSLCYPGDEMYRGALVSFRRLL